MEKVNCYRDNNTFVYTSGKASFRGGCDNSLIISDKDYIELRGIKDSLVVISDGSTETSPIYNFNEVLRKSEELLGGAKVKYYRPEHVKEREDLDTKSLEELSRGLYNKYGIRANDIQRIERTGKIDGIFYISTEMGKELVLKHYGKERKRLEILATISNAAPGVFPNILSTTAGFPYWKMSDGYYGLESFVKGRIHKRDSEYFTQVGQAMAKMHTSLNGILGQNEQIREPLRPKARSISESNMASLWIDLTCAGFPEAKQRLEKVSKSNLRQKILGCPESFIHGDINNANVIWTSDGPRFIDIETVKFSRRILDFEGTMLFQGNMLPPEYVPNSFTALTGGYNEVSKTPLQENELSIVKDLMVYVLLKNFVIRNIRRGDERNSLSRLNKNISQIDSELQ